MATTRAGFTISRVATERELSLVPDVHMTRRMLRSPATQYARIDNRLDPITVRPIRVRPRAHADEDGEIAGVHKLVDELPHFEIGTWSLRRTWR